jgi:hypothetical protein
MTDQPGPDLQHDDAAREPAGGKAADGEDTRLLIITFAGSLAAILAGTIMIGLSLAFLRLYHELPFVVQSALIGGMPVAILFAGALVLQRARNGRLKNLSEDFRGLWRVTLILYFALAAAGVLFFVGLAAGVK